MMAADMMVALTWTEHTVALRRQLTGGSDDAAMVQRLLAPILDGYKRADAARRAGMDRQALRCRVHRRNAGGVKGLAGRHRGGTARRLSARQEAEIAGSICTMHVRIPAGQQWISALIGTTLR